MKAKYIPLFLFVLFLSAAVTLMLKAGNGTQKESLSDTTSLVGSTAPEIKGGKWINSCPLILSELHGKVILVEFWTFGCNNCRNTIPHLKSWREKFNSDSLVIIGVHTPEFDLEKSPERVKRETRKLGIKYAVVTDNDYKTWDAYRQEYWPTLYLIDKNGTVRYVHIGEGNYEDTQQKIILLLAESTGS
ncbi:MAG: redoxin domain-containing protein [Bacteroidota bacterium]